MATSKNEVAIPSITLGPWQEPIVLSGAQLDTTSLALASIGESLFLFGKQEGTSNIYWAQPLGSAALKQLQFGGTPPLTQGPVTAAGSATGQLTLVWTGAPGDDTLWMNTYDGSPGNWIGNQVHINLPPGSIVCSGTGPALAFLNGVAYLLTAGGGLNGYFVSTSNLPTSNNWSGPALMGNTGTQSTFATPRLVLSSSLDGPVLLSLWVSPTGSQVVYGMITPSSANTVGVVSAPIASPSTPVYAAASLQGVAAVLLWNTGQYQIHAGGIWSPVKAPSSNFQLPSNTLGFSAFCHGNTLYVAWANGSNVIIQTATVTI